MKIRKVLIPKYKVGQIVTIQNPYAFKVDFVKKGTQAVITKIVVEQSSEWFEGFIWYFILFEVNTRWGSRTKHTFFTSEEVSKGFISVP